MRSSHHLPSHADRLRARGLLTLPEIVGRLGVHTSTIKAGRRAILLTAHQANDKNIPLFDPPDPEDPLTACREFTAAVSDLRRAVIAVRFRKRCNDGEPVGARAI